MSSKKKRREIENIKKLLIQTKWGGMTYMMVPSLLERSACIIKELENSRDPELLKIRSELIELAGKFHREK